jgi:hypothetical protein
MALDDEPTRAAAGRCADVGRRFGRDPEVALAAVFLEGHVVGSVPQPR